MKKLLHAVVAVPGDAATIYTASANLKDLVVQLTNQGATAATAVLHLQRGNDSYRISPAAIDLQPGGALSEITVPGLAPGDALSLTVTSEDNSVEVQTLVWGEVCSVVRS